MLHILLLILKIIGIILASILGLLVLLVLVVLLVPICYQGNAKCDGKVETLCAALKVTWLFRLIQVNVKYENKKLKYTIRIAWKTLGKENKREESKDEKVKSVKTEEHKSEQVAAKEVQKVDKKPEEVQQCIQKETKTESIVCERPVEEFKKSEIKSEVTQEEAKKKTSIFEKIKNKFSDLKNKLTGIVDKIKCTLKNICDKLKMLIEKKDKVMQFIYDKNHITAFLKIKKEGFKLLKRLIPKKFVLKVRYGFEDPSLTGKVLALLCMLYPFTEDHMEIVPDFEDKVLKGHTTISGRIYIIHFVMTAWNLVWCKQIRMLYKDIRNFKL